MKVYYSIMLLFLFSLQLNAQSLLKESINPNQEYAANYSAKNKVQAEVFPNPCSGGFLHVQLDNPENECTISIYNVLGKQISSRSVEAAGTFLFDVSNLPVGIYFVHITSQHQEKIVKIQLQ